MDDEEKVILASSDETAQYKTVTGWVDRHGHFWGEDERQARYSGSTHYECDKGKGHGSYSKHSYCEPCHAEAQTEKFAAMERRKWNGVDALVIFGTDEYFFDFESLNDYCADEEVKPESLALVICEPQFVSEFELFDHCQDIIPEDGDEYSIHSDIREAAKRLNEIIRQTKEPVSWIQGKYAAIINKSA